MGGAKPEEDEAGQWRAQSIEELFEALESPLLSYAGKLVGESDLAQDLVQEAFVRLHERFEFVRKPRVWLYRTIHNLAMNHHRSGRKVVRLENPGVAGETVEFLDPEPLPDEQIERLEEIGRTRLCLESLDSRRRELVRLKFEEGLSYKEISVRTGLSVGNVGYLLHHALKDLAAELRKNGSRYE